MSSFRRAHSPLVPSSFSRTSMTGSEDETPTVTPRGPLTPRPSRDRIGGNNDDDAPVLSHRLRHTSSILAIALSDGAIYAGTQGGEIVVFDLATFERRAIIEGHRASILSICLSEDHKLLYTSAADRVVNVWNTADLSRKYCLLSRYDVGDIFCLAVSPLAGGTIYMGAQNTTIQWCCLDRQKERGDTIGRTGARSARDDPFFDSRGPGGSRSALPLDANVVPKHARGGEVIEIGHENVRQFAHFGYVYCMLLASRVPEAGGDEILITGGGDGVVKLWKTDHQKDGAISEWYTLTDDREEGHSVLSIALDGTFLYAGRTGGEIDVWDLETRQLVRNVKAFRDDVTTIAVEAGFMFAAAMTGEVRKFDRQYSMKSKLRLHEGRILASAFAYFRGRPVYVTGGNDKTLAIWDVSNSIGTQSATLKTSNEQLFEALRRFVSYRTVSSDLAHQGDCRRGASYLRTVFRNFGAITEMLPTSDAGNPIILARFRGNQVTRDARKKILFYGHYDVVAADNENGKWICDPFAMEGIDGYLYGRGTSDNKGPIMAAIFACAELTAEQALESDIIFLIEGEEENGSRGFESAVRQHKEKIGDVDWILLANSYWLDDRVPCVTYGLRGVIHAKVQVESSHPDMHSGVDGSAQLDEPLKDLVMLLSTLTGNSGSVKIPGFYEPIPDITTEERQLYADITSSLIERNPDLGDRDALEESLMRRWREASLTIHRFHTSGPENASVIPRLARAAISMRLVPNQEAAQIAKLLVDYLNTEFARLGSNNKLSVTIDHMAEPWLGDWRNQIFQTLERAIMDTWGPIEQPNRRRVSTLTGLPITGQTTGQITATASSQPTDTAHSPTILAGAGGYFNGTSPSLQSPTNSLTKLTPATSSILATGSALPPDQPLTPMDTSNAPTAAPDAPQPRTSQHPRSKPNGTSSFPNTIGSNTPQPLTGENRTSHRKPLYIREGGSIPAIRFLEKEFDAPAAHFPCGQASDSAHLDNERLRLVNLYKSKEIFRRVFGCGELGGR